MFCGKNILFTIGHSAHSLTKFLSLLNQHKIQAVVDVRSTPFSRYCPHFNRQVLARSLRDNKINYVLWVIYWARAEVRRIAAKKAR